MSHSANYQNGIFTYFVGGFVKSAHAKIGGDFISEELLAGEYIGCKIETENFKDFVTVALD